MEKISKQDNEFIKNLLSLTLDQVVQYIELVSLLDETVFTNGLKVWFVKKFISKFDITVRIFKCTQKRYKTEALFTEKGYAIIGISKMDSKDMDAAYIKLYNNQNSGFLNYIEKHEQKTLELVGVAI